MPDNRAIRPPRGERGIALIAALLVVLLTSILAATFITTTIGERSVSSNTHVARAALLTADAGVRTAQQVLANMAQTKLDSLALLWPGNGAIITAPATLFPAGATVINCTNPVFSASATITWADSDLTDSMQTYNYNYTIVSTGNTGLVGARKVQSQGVLRVSAERGSFADFLIFTDTHTMSNGNPIWFTSSSSFDGRVHTNGEYRFAYQPTFQDQVTSVNSRAYYYNGGSPVELNASNNGTTDVPHFYGGFQRGAGQIDLPPNSYGQENAALGYSPGNTTSPTNSQINTAIGNGSGSGTPPNGIYPINSGGAMTGGIYVQGSLDQCVCKLDASGNQVYIMTQGGTVKTITINRALNLTTVKVGSGAPVPYTGVPRGVIYANGSISDLRGPDRVSGTPPPAIATDNQLMIAATNDIVVQRDVTYQDYNGGQNVLGLYSSGGKVRIASGAPADMNLDAYVMATGSAGDLEVDNYDSGSPRGTFHLRGGCVESFYGPFFTFNTAGVLQTGYARDFHYDRRGFIPPYFPLTNRFQADEPTARTLAWKEL